MGRRHSGYACVLTLRGCELEIEDNWMSLGEMLELNAVVVHGQNELGKWDVWAYGQAWFAWRET